MTSDHASVARIAAPTCRPVRRRTTIRRGGVNRLTDCLAQPPVCWRPERAESGIAALGDRNDLNGHSLPHSIVTAFTSAMSGGADVQRRGDQSL